MSKKTRNLAALARLTHHTGEATLPWNPNPGQLPDKRKEASRNACRKPVQETD